MEASASRADAGPARPYGEVFDRGYQHYSGTREGRAHAMQALVWYSIKRALGIKKKWTSKLIAIALYLFAYLPALVIIGVQAFVPNVSAVELGYHRLNEFIRFALILFAAAAAAEMLCDDRRDNVLPLYFSRALTRLDYLAAKIVALILLLATIALGPPLLLFLGKCFLAANPVTYFAHHLGDLGRVVTFGLLTSAYFGAIGLSIAAYTNRKGIAAAVYIGGLLIVSGLSQALFHSLHQAWHKYLLLVSPASLVTVFSRELFHGPRSGDNDLTAVSLSLGLLIAGMLVVVAIAAFIMHRRYLADT